VAVLAAGDIPAEGGAALPGVTTVWHDGGDPAPCLAPAAPGR